MKISNKSPIGFFDSGIGGLTTLEETKKILPNENYIFLGDNLNNPYGDKTPEEILSLVEASVVFLINQGCKIIVLACNTATNISINYLRKKYNIIFIGTEPAIKLATKEKINGNILVMATPSTINSEKFKETNKKYGNKNVLLHPCAGLANLIENNEQEKINTYLSKLLYGYDNIETIVLGCTHYIYIKENIRKLIPSVKFVDGNEGIARQVKKILIENDLINTQEKIGETKKIFTKIKKI